MPRLGLLSPMLYFHLMLLEKITAMKFKRAAILSLSILTIMATDTVAPLVGQISASFPDVNPTLIKLTITLPSLIMIFFGFIAGYLVRPLAVSRQVGHKPSPDISFCGLSSEQAPG